jgi:hypothetical protein
METVMSNEAVAVPNTVSAYDGLLKWFFETLPSLWKWLDKNTESFMKTVMTNKVRKILGRLKPGMRRATKSAGLFRKDGVHF